MQNTKTTSKLVFLFLLFLTILLFSCSDSSSISGQEELTDNQITSMQDVDKIALSKGFTVFDISQRNLSQNQTKHYKDPNEENKIIRVDFYLEISPQLKEEIISYNENPVGLADYCLFVKKYETETEISDKFDFADKVSNPTVVKPNSVNQLLSVEEGENVRVEVETVDGENVTHAEFNVNGEVFPALYDVGTNSFSADIYSNNVGENLIEFFTTNTEDVSNQFMIGTLKVLEDSNLPPYVVSQGDFNGSAKTIKEGEEGSFSLSPVNYADPDGDSVKSYVKYNDGSWQEFSGSFDFGGLDWGENKIYMKGSDSSLESEVSQANVFYDSMLEVTDVKDFDGNLITYQANDRNIKSLLLPVAVDKDNKGSDGIDRYEIWYENTGSYKTPFLYKTLSSSDTKWNFIPLDLTDAYGSEDARVTIKGFDDEGNEKTLGTKVIDLW